jgi:hypothetical protein
MTADIDMRDRRFVRAVTNIYRRAEKQTDIERLLDIIVESEFSDRVASPNSQLILGRRGTGKTHLVLGFKARHQKFGEVIHYVDCNTLVSGYGEDDPIVEAKRFFTALLNEIGTFLLDQLTQLELPDPGTETRIEQTLINGLVRFLEPESDREGATFNYRQISEIIANLLTDLDIKRYNLILDEWSSIPEKIQPHVAEYLKRCLLYIPAVLIKILAVHYRNFLRAEHRGTAIGIERGADITDTIDIDSYLVYDEKADYMKDFFVQVLYNHLAVELGWDLEVDIVLKKVQVYALFSQERTFIELVRAAEGNCRDFLCIFSEAVNLFRVRTSDSSTISILQIQEAAKLWFEQEKEINIQPDREAMETLNHILNRVLINYKSRSFMVEMSKADHPRIVKLLSNRVIHKLAKTYAHKDRPGVRFNIFTLDYGAYVRYKNTTNEPYDFYSVWFTEPDLQKLPQDERQDIVPIDDLRSIRRIIFDPDSLETTHQLPLF